MGCASGPQLDKYPRAQIDRPYTLPSGVANWQVLAGVGVTSNPDSVFAFGEPLVWQESLSDDWTLTWMPLPLLASHQLSYDNTGYLGFTIGFDGLGYATLAGFFIDPTATMTYRRKLTSSFALDTSANVTLGVNFNGNPLPWGVGIGVRGLYQLSPTFAVSAGPHLGVSNAGSYSYSSDSEVVTYVSSLSTTVPLSAGIAWSVSRRVDLNLNYELDSIGEPSGVSSQTLYLQFVYFW